MRNTEITVGLRCLTKVSGVLVEVEVTGRKPHPPSLRPRAVWIVKRADTGRVLEPRSAAALRPAPRKVTLPFKGSDLRPGETVAFPNGGPPTPARSLDPHNCQACMWEAVNGSKAKGHTCEALQDGAP